MFRSLRGLFNKGLKILIVITVFTLILNIFGRAISGNKAQTRSLSENIKLLEKQEDAIYNDPAIKNNKSASAVIQVYRAFSCSTIGAGCENKQAGFNNSILGSATKVGLYPLGHPPASGIIETYDTFAKAGIVPKSYAAEGIGFSALRGFRPIWLLFRNLAFAILVLVVVAIAFMMMFRMKMSAQTSISIESALPKIVITMLLVTFSYAIAGFLIDVMYIVMGLLISVLCGGTAETYCPTGEYFSTYTSSSFAPIWTSFFPYSAPSDSVFGKLMAMIGIEHETGLSTVFGLSDSILNVLPVHITSIIYGVSFFANMFILSYVLAIAQNAGWSEVFNNVTAFTFSFGSLPKIFIGSGIALAVWTLLAQILPRAIMSLLIFMTLIGLFFRIYFMLLFSYLRIILYILFAPAYLLLEAIPGNNAFSSWFKNLFGELMTFPIVVGLFVTGSLITNNYLNPSDPNTHVWAPPFLGGIEQGSYIMIVGMGILFLVPDLTAQAKGFLGVSQGGGNKWGIGMFFSGAGAGLAGASMLTGRGLGLLKILPGGLAEQATKGIGSLYKRTLQPYAEPLRSRASMTDSAKKAREDILRSYEQPTDESKSLNPLETFRMGREVAYARKTITDQVALQQELDKINKKYGQTSAVGKSLTREERRRMRKEISTAEGLAAENEKRQAALGAQKEVFSAALEDYLKKAEAEKQKNANTNANIPQDQNNNPTDQNTGSSGSGNP